MQVQFDIKRIELNADESEELARAQEQLPGILSFGIRTHVVWKNTTVDNNTQQAWNMTARIGMALHGEIGGMIVSACVPVREDDSLPYIKSRWERTVTEFVTHDITPAIMQIGSVSVFMDMEDGDE